MFSLSQASIKQSILALGAVGVLCAIAIGAQSAWQQGVMKAQAEQVFTAKDAIADILPPPMYLVEMRLVLSQSVEGTMARDAARKRFGELKTDYEARVAYWKKQGAYGLEEHLLGQQHTAAQRFMAAAQAEVIDAPAQTSPEQLHQRLAALQGLYDAHRAGVDATVVAGNRFAEQSAAAFDAAYQRSSQLTLAILVAAALAVALGYRWVYRSLQRPLAASALWARRLATGDLTPHHAEAGPPRRDAIGELEAAMEDMRSQWLHIVQAVSSSAIGVASASADITQGNTDLEARTGHQTRALQQTAATVDELTTTVHNNADNARKAHDLALAASGLSSRGGAVVPQVVGMIGTINESSRRIANIIGTIDGIAFQTNILALNAAVEAARAGEQGRGFAVVASEVRSLAQRSAEAAKEIKGLISTSVARVEQGSQLAGVAGQTMNEIVASIVQVSAIVGQITQASADQSVSVSQVSQAVSQMDRATRQNSALVEVSAAAAQGLQAQAQALVQAVSVFKFKAS